MAPAMVAAECEGRWRHGLVQALECAGRIRKGRVNAQAEPAIVVENTGRVRASLAGGFVWPAIVLGLDIASEQAADHGHCMLDVGAGAYAGVLAHHLERAADQGLVALGFGPASADDGAAPAAMALPRHAQPSLLVDLTASDLAQGHLLLAQDQQQTVPLAWALDDRGAATTDAGVAADAIGDVEQGRMALIVGLMAAAVQQTVGNTEHCATASAGYRFIVIDPVRLGATDFDTELDTIIALAMMDNARPLPGTGRRHARARAESSGLWVSSALYEQLREHAGKPPRAACSADNGTQDQVVDRGE
jgi:LDH2 family malate/lactate/ureidoglycolate dehydrogenase